MKYERRTDKRVCPHRSKEEWCKKSSNPKEWKICIIDRPECLRGEEPNYEQTHKKKTNKTKK